jgi:hypothetical protein
MFSRNPEFDPGALLNMRPYPQATPTATLVAPTVTPTPVGMTRSTAIRKLRLAGRSAEEAEAELRRYETEERPDVRWLPEKGGRRCKH